MKALQSIQDIQNWSQACKKNGHKVSFVPTMGFLHEGHLSLIRLAKKNSDQVCVSIFVNPLQFATHEDLDAYPQDLRKDFALLEKEGADVVFVPKPKEIYQQGFQTKVDVTELSKNLCGKSRPGHFEGVATVVLKLFNIVQPDLAVFGDKDFQQKRVIERMVEDLHLNLKILGAPIGREYDGLAMSSRNMYLSSEDRENASVLYRSLQLAKERVEKGQMQSSSIIAAVREFIERAHPTGIDYIQICDAKSLKDVVQIKTESVLCLAVYFGKARLIDNVILEPFQQ
jgi:pantoate--beta-alanine ligase